MRKPKDKYVTVRVKADTKKRLQAIADASDQSLSELITAQISRILKTESGATLR